MNNKTHRSFEIEIGVILGTTIIAMGILMLISIFATLAIGG